MGASIFFTATMIRAFSQRGYVASVKSIDAPMLMHVWQEFEYRINMCLVTRGAHIEHL
jgi:hypothetical protein